MLAFVLFGAFTISFFYEVQVMDDSKMKLIVATKLAANDSFGRFQSLYADHVDYYGVSTSDYTSNQDYSRYLNSIETQAHAQGVPGSSDIWDIISFLRRSTNSHHTASDEQFSPLQFDWTYLEQTGVQEFFAKSMRELVDYNLGTKSFSETSGIERCVLTSATVTIDGPQLIDLTESVNSQDFEEIFGSTQRDALLNNINNHDSYDSMFNYIIAYDCTFTVTWRHNTRSPLFEGIQFDMPPIVLHKRYIVTN